MHEFFKREQILNEFEKDLRKAWRIISQAYAKGLEDSEKAGLDLQTMFVLMQGRNFDFARRATENPELFLSDDDEG